MNLAFTLVSLAAAVFARPALKERENGNPVVNLGCKLDASYQGVYNATTNLNSYYGIRYAASPVGNLRFRAPQGPANMTGIQNGTNAAVPTCVQASPYYFGLGLEESAAEVAASSAELAGQEDCLFLNVLTPANATDGDKLPVLVYIYGGGYSIGGISQYDLTYLAEQAAGRAILVAIQYRVGAFGFLAGETLGQDGDYNVGILDQRAGLQWVQKYIGRFGGDASHVTIWGESAGAGSVLQHVIADNGKTQPALFKAAIFSSPFEPPQYQYNSDFTENVYSAILSSSNSTTLADLRGLSALELSRAQLSVIASANYAVWPLTPVIDNKLVVARPLELLDSGRFNNVKILSLHNVYEGRPFQEVNGTTEGSAYVRSLMPGLDETSAQRIARVYAETFGSQANSFVYGEGTFICPAIWLAQAAEDSYLGIYARPPSDHGSDLVAYFPDLLLPGVSYPSAGFARQFTSAILSFAIDYNPNTYQAVENTPRWLTFAQSPRVNMVFNETLNTGDVTTALEPTDVNLINRCQLWREVAPQIPLK